MDGYVGAETDEREEELGSTHLEVFMRVCVQKQTKGP